VLVIPRQPIESTNDITPAQKELIGHLTWVAARIAEQEGIAADGYRLVWNCGKDGGQTVDHIHLHVLGGRPMAWPPG
jgi:histidine triad (HIT) family protein